LLRQEYKENSFKYTLTIVASCGVYEVVVERICKPFIVNQKKIQQKINAYKQPRCGGRLKKIWSWQNTKIKFNEF